jgi:hypothetical protein
VLLLPYTAFALLESLLLVAVFLAPQLPSLIPLVAPPIRVFFGEQYLHYPYNLVFLPFIFCYADMVLSLLIGPVAAGMTVEMISQAKNNLKPQIFLSLKKTAKKYIFLLGVWLVVFLATFIIFNGVKFIATSSVVKEFFGASDWRMTRLAQLVSFSFCLVLIETFCAYAIPAIMLENKRISGGLKRSFTIAKPLFLVTLILIALPTVFNTGVVLGQEKVLPVLINRTLPEVVWPVMVVGFIFFVFTEMFRVVPLTILFLSQQRAEEANWQEKQARLVEVKASGEAYRLTQKLIWLKSKENSMVRGEE